MIAGLDLGTTLAKAVWGDGPSRHTRLVPLEQLDALARTLREVGVTRLALAGVSYQRLPQLEGLERVEVTGADVEREVAVQATGARRLLDEANLPSQAFLLVSLGTGISYTHVDAERVRRFPLGSALGGGFLQGASRLLGAASWEEFVREAAQGQPLDLLVQDQLPATRGTPLGALVLAHLARATAETPRADAYASLISVVATGVARDLALMQLTAAFVPPPQVVFVGTLAQVAPLRARLEAYVRGLLQREPVVLEQAPFALALGAQLEAA